MASIDDRRDVNGRVLCLMLPLFVLLFAPLVSAQNDLDVNVADVLERFRSNDVRDQIDALRVIRQSHALLSDDQIQQVLFEELSRFNRATLRAQYRWQQVLRASPEDEQYDGAFGLEVLSTVVELRDPRSIPLLVEATVSSGPVATELAQWGDVALPSVLAAWRGDVERPELNNPLLRNGLLRSMEQMLVLGTISEASRQEILEIARELVGQPVGVVELRAAIPLWARLGTSDLLEVVERMAADDSEVLVRMGDPDWVESVQRIARDTLAERETR